jgi:hypothetical protein
MISNLLGGVMRSLRMRTQPIRTRDDLAQFLKAQSAFVSQKTVVEYCRIKAGVRWQKLFAEAAFKEVLEVSRWLSMRAVLCDLTVIVEPQSPDRVARTAGAIVFDALPVHSMLRSHDREVIVNNLRFGMVRFWENLLARAADRAALAQSLLDVRGERDVQ